jgi:hypothetical protein
MRHLMNDYDNLGTRIWAISHKLNLKLILFLSGSNDTKNGYKE